MTYGVPVWDTCKQNRFEKIEKQHVRATKIIKSIPKSVERNRTLEKAGWDPIIYIYKRRVAIEVHKIMNEEVNID